jgi:hypothetical protein
MKTFSIMGKEAGFGADKPLSSFEPRLKEEYSYNSTVQ